MIMKMKTTTVKPITTGIIIISRFIPVDSKDSSSSEIRLIKLKANQFSNLMILTVYYIVLWSRLLGLIVMGHMISYLCLLILALTRVGI